MTIVFNANGFINVLVSPNAIIYRLALYSITLSLPAILKNSKQVSHIGSADVQGKARKVE